MAIVGFNFTKISGERKHEFKIDNEINTNIEFLDVEKANVPMLKEDTEVITANFRFTISYTENQEKEGKKEYLGLPVGRRYRSHVCGDMGNIYRYPKSEPHNPTECGK